MKPIERRILAMEAALAPPPQGPVILEAREGPEFQVLLAQARASGARVIVAHRDWLERQKEVVGGVEHMAWAVAGFEYCAGMPSKEGRRSLLEDMICGLQGNVIGPVTPTYL